VTKPALPFLSHSPGSRGFAFSWRQGWWCIRKTSRHHLFRDKRIEIYSIFVYHHKMNEKFTRLKKVVDISSEFSFYLALAFLFLINFTIAGCYILFTILALQLVFYSVLKKKWPETPTFFKYFLPYIFFSLVSTAFSINKAESLSDNKEFFVFLLIPIFLIILNTRKRLEHSLLAVLSSAVISALLGIGISIYKGISLDFRLKGLTSHWMTYSGLLMFTFIFFFVYLFYEKRMKVKLILGGVLFVIFVVILLSLTRSVWVGIFISTGIFIIYYKPRILYAIVPIVVLLVFILPASVKNRVTSIFDMNNETNRDRFYMYKTGFNIFKEYPLTGVGAANVGKVYNKYKPAEATLSNPHLHNNFLQELAERGIFALLGLVGAFVSVFIFLVKKIKNSIEFEKVVATGVLFAYIGFMVAGLFEYNFGDTEIKFILFYFLSIPFLRLSEEK
jgi:O-antigen ligase